MQNYKIVSDIILQCAIKHEAIIYGNYVKNKIIIEYNKKLYYKKYTKKLKKEYWNPEYRPETKDRTLILDNMNICFKYIKKLNNFINDLCNKFNDIKIKKDSQFSNKQREYIITYNDIKINLTICISLNIEPPFQTSRLASDNIVIKYEIDNYMFSKNTFKGLYSLESKCDMIYSLTKLIRNKHDFVCSCGMSDNSVVPLILNIVENISNGWNILNNNYIKIDKYIDKTCVICLEQSPDLQLMESSYFHKNCFCDYIRNTEIKSDEFSYYFIGPYREKCIICL